MSFLNRVERFFSRQQDVPQPAQEPVHQEDPQVPVEDVGDELVGDVHEETRWERFVGKCDDLYHNLLIGGKATILCLLGVVTRVEDLIHAVSFGIAPLESALTFYGFILLYTLCVSWAVWRGNWFAGFFGLIFCALMYYTAMWFWAFISSLVVALASIIVMPFVGYDLFVASMVLMVAIDRMYKRYFKKPFIICAGIILSMTFGDMFSWCIQWFFLKWRSKAGTSEYNPHGVGADYVEFCAAHEKTIARYKTILSMVYRVLIVLFDVLDPVSNPLFDSIEADFVVKRPSKYRRNGARGPHHDEPPRRAYYYQFDPHGQIKRKRVKTPAQLEAKKRRQKARRERTKLKRREMRARVELHGEGKNEAPVEEVELKPSPKQPEHLFASYARQFFLDKFVVTRNLRVSIKSAQEVLDERYAKHVANMKLKIPPTKFPDGSELRIEEAISPPFIITKNMARKWVKEMNEALENQVKKISPPTYADAIKGHKRTKSEPSVDPPKKETPSSLDDTDGLTYADYVKEVAEDTVPNYSFTPEQREFLNTFEDGYTIADAGVYEEFEPEETTQSHLGINSVHPAIGSVEAFGYRYVYITNVREYAVIPATRNASTLSMVKWLKERQVHPRPISGMAGFAITPLKGYNCEEIPTMVDMVYGLSTTDNLFAALRCFCNAHVPDSPLHGEYWIFSHQWKANKNVHVRIRNYRKHGVPTLAALSEILTAEASKQLNRDLNLPSKLKGDAQLSKRNKAIKDYFMNRRSINSLAAAFDYTNAIIAFVPGKVFKLVVEKANKNDADPFCFVSCDVLNHIPAENPDRFRGKRVIYFSTTSPSIQARAYHALKRVGARRLIRNSMYHVSLPEDSALFNTATEPAQPKGLWAQLLDKCDCVCGTITKKYSFWGSRVLYPLLAIFVASAIVYFIYYVLYAKKLDFHGGGKGKTKGRAQTGKKKAKWTTNHGFKRNNTTKEQYLEEMHDVYREWAKNDEKAYFAHLGNDPMATFYEEQADELNERLSEMKNYMLYKYGVEMHGEVLQAMSLNTTPFAKPVTKEEPVKAIDVVVQQSDEAKYTNPNFNSCKVSGDLVGRGVVVASKTSPTGKALVLNKHVLGDAKTVTIETMRASHNQGKRKLISIKTEYEVKTPIAEQGDLVAIPINSVHKPTTLPWIPHEKLEPNTKVGVKVRNTVTFSELISNHTNNPQNELNVHFEKGDSGSPVLKVAHNNTPIAFTGLYAGKKGSKGVVMTPTLQFLEEAGMTVHSLN